jgi:hypothetical protein
MLCECCQSGISGVNISRVGVIDFPQVQPDKRQVDGWNIGVHFIEEPIFMALNDDGDFGYGGCYTGSTRMATNQSILVATAGRRSFQRKC